MGGKGWKLGAARFTTLAILGAIALNLLPNKILLVATPRNQIAIFQCTESAIENHVQQLKEGDAGAFDALVACKSKAVPALIAATKDTNENLRIIAIGTLGQIGSEAALAVPSLAELLK
jgi:HEAT repeat protein